ncbi:MAG: alpha-2-macroglobulin family protein [Candidatus Omnitrophota bacterium]
MKRMFAWNFSTLLILLTAVCVQAQPIASFLFASGSVESGHFSLTPVAGYQSPSMSGGTFPAGGAIRDGYRVTLLPGQAALLSAKIPVTAAGPVVITLEYGVASGAPQIAVAALNAENGEADGQLAYTQFTHPAEYASTAVQRLHVIYSPPSGAFLPAVQPSLFPSASQSAEIILYSLSVYSLDLKEALLLTTIPNGTFDSPSNQLIENINLDKGDVLQDGGNGRLILKTIGGGEAANAAVQTLNAAGLDQETLLLAKADVSRLSGNDGMTALVLTDGAWTTALFVKNENIPLAPASIKLMAAGLYTPHEAPIYAVIQNGGGQNPSELAVDNLILQAETLNSIVGLPELTPDSAPKSLSAALVMPKELYTGGKGSFSLTTVESGEQKPVDMPFDVFLVKDREQILLDQGRTGAKGFANKTFTVPNLASGAWKVEARSFGETLLLGDVAVKNGGVLFIETDKPIYKPGQTIQGRVLYLNNELSPLQGDVEISVSDAKGIRIFKETKTANEYGVAPFNLPLAAELNFGTWKITAKCGTDIQTESDIEVDRYVLPSFEISLNSSKTWFLVDERVTGSVDSRYFFGKPVEGIAHIEALKYVGEWQTYATADGRLVDGKFAYDLPPVVYVAGTTGAEGAGTLQLKVTVTDDAGHEEKTDQILKIVDSGATLKLIPEAPVIKPGLNQEILITAETPGGAPLDLKAEIDIIFLSEDGSSLGEVKDSVLTENGLAIYRFDVPEKTIMATITASAELDGKKTEESLLLHAAYSPGAHFIHLRQRNEGTIAVGEEAVFDVFATNPGSVFFDVYANGRTVFSNAIDGREIRFTAAAAMSGEAKIAAYMIQPDNEVSADVLPFNVELTAPVNLDVKFNAEEVKPGDPVTLSVQADGISMVGLAIVDESVFALAAGRLNLRNVFAELERIFMEPQIETHPGEGDIIGRTPFYGGKGTQDVLDDNNLQIIATKDMLVPKAAELNPWLFWGNEKMRNNLPPILFPAPGIFEDVAAGGEDQSGQTYQEPDRVRTYFPETWLWNPEWLTGADGAGSLDLTAPDSITTWKLHAVSTSPQGLGIAEGSLRVFQDFFAEPDLPYSVIRGDRFPLKVRVFNYIDEDQLIRVTLDNAEALGLQDDPVQEITVPANGAASAVFTLQPNKVGLLPISLIAQSSKRADAIRKDLLVEPEGVRQEVVSNGFLKDATEVVIDTSLPEPLISDPELRPDTDDMIPPAIEIVPDSERLRVAVTASLVGQSLDGLDDLLGMPYGCGEQNMIFLAPDVEVLRYLKITGQLAPAIRAKAEQFIMTGYQRELTYRRDDGSFSAFGQEDDSGSLWLTAFVLSTFSNAREVQTIDSSVLDAAAAWIVSHQLKDGSWQPVGFLIHKELSGGLNGDLALSAFAANALLEYGAADAAALEKALVYLEGHISNQQVDSYVLSLIAYALARAQRPSAAQAIDELLKQGIADSKGLHWEPHAIEATGYAAMALALLDRLEAQPALEWLAAQRNSLGGYGSTQDTVVAFKALTQAAAGQSRELNASIDVLADGQLVHTFTLNSQNFDVLQTVELPLAKELTLKSTGVGKVMYQAVHSFNIPSFPETVGEDMLLKVKYSAEHVAVDDIVDIFVTVNYFGAEKETGMSIVDVSVPTGFSVVQESLEKAKTLDNVKRIEQAGRKVIFYLDKLTSGEPFEFSFQVKALFPVKADGGTSSAYLYYKPETRADAGGIQLTIEGDNG